MKYEYGYTIHAGRETKEVIMGTVEESDRERIERAIRIANSVEAGPNIIGLVRPQTTFHWIRPQSAA